MTTYRLMDGASGRPGVGSSGTQPPATPNAYGGNFIAGTAFSAVGEMLWLQGYWWWVPTGGDTGAQKFCLWNRNSSTTQVLIPNSTVTSGTLTAGAFNFIPLATQIQLAPGELYICATGWTSVNGFPITNNQFASGQPYVNGITNGPLTAWGDAGNGSTYSYFGSNYGLNQGLFSVASNDPTAQMPNAGSNSSNFWIDVQLSDTAPGGYTGSYRVFPNMNDATGEVDDTATNFTLGMEFSLSQPCTINNVWFYSKAGYSQLPTSIGVYQVSGASLVTSNSSPSWSGVAGSGWISASLTGTLAAGTSYKVAVCNGAGSPSIWNVTTQQYFGTGYGGNGLTAGIITVPNNATADAPGQATYNAGATLTYPGTYAPTAQNYWVDIEITPQAAAVPPTPQVAFMSSM